MTNTIKTALVAFSAVFALAGAAQAEDVKIMLAGKDAKAVHTAIINAAVKVCRASVADFSDFSMASEGACVNDTISKANADLRVVTASRMAVAENAARSGER